MKTKVVQISPVSASEKSNGQPLYASLPSAGFPSVGDDFVEDSLDITDFLVDNPSATFFVKVNGDSMEGAKIFNNDILVVNRALQAKPDSIVVAAVNGELVVKRLKKTATGLVLASENEHYEPILLTESDECFIWGVVTGSARKLS